MRDDSTYQQRVKNLFFKISSSKISTIFVIFLLLFAIFPLTISQADSQPTFSYIVELTTPSLFQQLQFNQVTLDQNNSFLKTHIFETLENISKFQQHALTKIKSIIGTKIMNHEIKHYHLLFNGLLLPDISESMATKLKQLSVVKQVYQNKQLHTFADNSTNISQSFTIQQSATPSSSVTQDFSSYSGQDVSIAFFDTGIDYTHPALNPVYQNGYDFVNDDSDPYDDNGHGTHVIGITAAQPTITPLNQQISGVAPNASVYAYKVLDENGEGYTSWFLSAFERAMDPNQDGDYSDHMDIISISAGSPDGSPSDLLSQAATQATNIGITVVSAAGNSGPTMDTISSPAIASQVIAVGASLDDSIVAPYSSRGDKRNPYIKPDIIATGHQITSTWPDNQYETLSGTSMATPYVTGIVACLLEQNPLLTPNQIQTMLHSQATPLGYNETTEGYGIIKKEGITTATPPLSANISISQPTAELLTINLSTSSIPSSAHISITLYQFDDPTNQVLLRSDQQLLTQNTTIYLSTTNLSTGYYTIQIDLYQHNNLTRLKQIIYLQSIHQTPIFAPQTVSSNQQFDVKITNNSIPSPALFIFIVPLRSIQFRIGSSVTFTAPHLFLSDKETVTASLFTIIPSFPPTINRHSITIVNTDTS